MTKFSGDVKLAAVQRYLEGVESYSSIAASIGASAYMVRNWVLQYEHQGEEAFVKSYTSYSVQFKLDVLNYMNTYGTSPNETAAIFRITSPGLIRKWRMQFQSQGIDALISKKKSSGMMSSP